ncbi:glycosyltransferase family 39 protein [Paludisphaera soli]|uniref:glycosyltransferase family 39 protein n=1 Tax=Paludisphaera soli TaxID=2712865 RepID=UPI0013ED3B75|nr:glycosyltransferase family 39 protein [Paludisphaera soli]
MTTQASRRSRFPAATVPALLALAVVVQTGWSRESSSITYDETFYLGAGVRTLQEGRLDPDLAAHGTAPLPILTNVVPAAWLGGARPRAEAWKGSGDRESIAGPRLLTTLTTLVPLVVLAFEWLRRRRGLAAATVGAGMLAFSPALLAHASLATSDAAFAFLATLAALAMGRHLAAPSPARLACAAAAVGLAFSAKYTGILLVPCFVIGRLAGLLREVRTAEDARDLRRKTARAGADAAAFLALAFLVAWACHGFQVDPTRTWLGLPAPAFVRAFEIQLLHDRIGHPAFFLGERSLRGWRAYHPFTMLVKSTLPELALAVVGLGLAARERFRMDGRADRERAMLLLFVVLAGATLVRSPISIGHRYTLALYPPIVVLAVDSLARATAAVPSRRLWGAALIGGQVATSLLAVPDYLAYFNPLAGGPDREWKLLADSNIDWGQDLPALKSVIDREGLRRVALDYFGTASTAEYGIQADPADALARPLDEYDALAISITKLHSVYPREGESRRAIADVYPELRRIAPSFRAGRSIFVYDLRRPEARAAFAASIEIIRRPRAAQAAARESSRSIAR